MLFYISLKSATQTSTCVNHNAVNKPNQKGKGLVASKTVGIDCACHNIKRPNGVGDIQEEERCELSDDYSILSLSLFTDTSM